MFAPWLIASPVLPEALHAAPYAPSPLLLGAPAQSLGCLLRKRSVRVEARNFTLGSMTNVLLSIDYQAVWVLRARPSIQVLTAHATHALVDSCPATLTWVLLSIVAFFAHWCSEPRGGSSEELQNAILDSFHALGHALMRRGARSLQWVLDTRFLLLGSFVEVVDNKAFPGLRR
eukprot:4749659-Amphidinium_carterae.1